MTTAPETIFYPTYNPPYSLHQIGAGVSAYGHTGAVDHKESVYAESGRASTSNASVVRGPWWMLGFEKRLSLVLFLLFAGAAIGFSLAGLEKMNFQTLIKTTTPAEGYWYQKLPWKTFIMLHILTTIPATFLSVFCFLPVTFKIWPRFHGLLGYLVSVLLVISCIGGGIMARRAQGGDLGAQLGYYLLASGAASTVVMGCIEGWRGAFDAHREWMLRAWVYNGALVTTHATAIISARVISLIGGYYTSMRCSEVGYLSSSELIGQDYPACSTVEAIANPDSFYVPIKASWDGSKLGQSSAVRAAFGMSMLLAIFLHCVGIEIYLHATRNEARKLNEWSKRRRIRAPVHSDQQYELS